MFTSADAITALREELLTTHHIGRIHRMLELGRAAKAGGPAGAEALKLIDKLAVGDVYERRLCLYALQTLGDGARLLPFTEDEAASLRALAFAIAPRICDDAQALLALKVAYTLRRDRDLIRALARKRRRPVIDRYLDWLCEEPGLHDFADLVPYATTAGVLRHLDRALARPSQIFWKRLARSAPAALAEVLCARLREVPGEPDAHTRQLINAYSDAIAERDPAAALPLLDLLFARGILTQARCLTHVASAEPRAALDLLERYDLKGSRALFRRRASDLTPAELRRVAARDPDLLGAAEPLRAGLSREQLAAVIDGWATRLRERPTWGFALLGAVDDPALRERAYERWSIAARDRDGVISVAALTPLPVDLREREARRHLHEIVALRTKPLARLPYARFLPWDEAEAAIRDQLGFPDGAVRGLALTSLLMIPGLRPKEAALVDRALTLVKARKNEQDPVRLRMIHALAQWPREVWRPEHARDISRVVRDALDAGDLSNHTAIAAETLVVRTFTVNPTVAARLLAVLIKERGNLYNPRLGDHLSDDDVAIAAPHLLEIAKSWVTLERWYQVLALGLSIGARLSRVPGLAACLVEVVNVAPYPATSRAALEILAQHDPQRYEQLLAPTLQRWEMRGWRGDVLVHAGRVVLPGRKRQPPLHPLVADAVAKIARSPRDLGEASRALTLLRVRALERFDALLPDLLAADASYVCISVVHWHLHLRRQDLLDPFLGGDVIRGRFATGNTAWVLPYERGFYRWTPGQNQAFARMLAAVIGDRQRATPEVWRCLAIYANLDSAPMEPLMAVADDARPAVQERGLRVMARCDRGQCAPTLIACLSDARARVAIYALRRALKSMTPTRALALLREAPMRKVTVAKELLRLLGELRHEGAYRRLLELEAGDLHRDVRVALLRALWDHLEREETWAIFDRAVRGDDWVMASRLGDIPADRLTATSDRRLSALLAAVLDRPEPEARVDLLTRAHALAIRDPRRAFLRACAGRLRSPFDDEVQAAMRALMHRGTEDDLRVLPELLQSALEDPRCLHVAIAAMLGFAIRERAVWIGAAEAAAAVLAADPRWVGLRVRCVAAARTGPELASFLIELARADQLTVASLADVQSALARVDPDALEIVTERLRASPDPAARFLTVGVLARDAAPGRGWAPERLDRLSALQGDASPIVAGAAAALFPPREMAADAAKRRADAEHEGDAEAP
ncbi:MAG: hypothetical protein R3A79_10825 [Nannocystaceae bacterium]